MSRLRDEAIVCVRGHLFAPHDCPYCGQNDKRPAEARRRSKMTHKRKRVRNGQWKQVKYKPRPISNCAHTLASTLDGFGQRKEQRRRPEAISEGGVAPRGMTGPSGPMSDQSTDQGGRLCGCRCPALTGSDLGGIPDRPVKKPGDLGEGDEMDQGGEWWPFPW